MQRRRWQLIGMAFGLTALFTRATPPARSSAQVAGSTTQAPADQIPLQGIIGGSAAITGVQLPGLVVTAQSTGIGRFTFGGTNPPPVEGTYVAKADIDFAQMPPALRNGTLTITATNGDEVDATYQGQVSAPDAAGFADVTANLTVTGGKGQYSGATGGGTVTGTINFLHAAAALSATALYTPAQTKP